MKELKLEDIASNDVLDFKPSENVSKLYIDPLKEIQHQPIAISCGTKFNHDVPVVTYGNFTCIVGASKSMKSFFKSALLACYIGGNAQNHFIDIKTFSFFFIIPYHCPKYSSPKC